MPTNMQMGCLKLFAFAVLFICQTYKTSSLLTTLYFLDLVRGSLSRISSHLGPAATIKYSCQAYGHAMLAGRKLLKKKKGVNQSNQANGSRNVNQSNQANRSRNVNQSNQANHSKNVNQSNQANGSG